MTITHKPSEVREKELRLALTRIQHGRARSGETKVSIASVARESGVSRALIHNHYPRIAEAIREAQGHSSRAQRDIKHQKLRTERDKNRALRLEIEELRTKISKLSSLNEMLLIDNRTLKSMQVETNQQNLTVFSGQV